jgi:hypothetical protein
MRCKSRSAGKSAKMLRSALLSENAKAGLSNSRVDTAGEVDVLHKNTLRLLQNVTMESLVDGFLMLSPTNQLSK